MFPSLDMLHIDNHGFRSVCWRWPWPFAGGGSERCNVVFFAGN